MIWLEIKRGRALRMSPAGLFAFYSRCQFCQFAAGSLPCGAVKDAQGATVWFTVGRAAGNISKINAKHNKQNTHLQWGSVTELSVNAT